LRIYSAYLCVPLRLGGECRANSYNRLARDFGGDRGNEQLNAANAAHRIVVRMAQRLWRHAYGFVVPTNNRAVHDQYRDVEFLAQDHVSRNDYYNGLRSVAGTPVETQALRPDAF
jgi:hypothetical protein